MILLLTIALCCIITASYLVFVVPCNLHTQAKQNLIVKLRVGTRIKTYAGDSGTIHAINSQQLVVFFDDGNRKTLLSEHIAAIISTPRSSTPTGRPSTGSILRPGGFE